MQAVELPLVIFTLLVQTAVGLLIVTEIARLAGGAAAAALLSRSEALSFGLGLAGMLVSLAHLGNPLNAPFTILNLGQSWLSREILCTGLFVAGAGALALSRRTGAPAGLAPLIGLATGLIGLAAILSMAKVYMIVTVPAWNSFSTVLNFLGTAFLLGGLVCTLLLGRPVGGAELPGGAGSGTARMVGLVLFFVLLGCGLKMVQIPFELIAGATVNARGVSALAEIGGVVLGWRLVLLASGMALFGYAAVGLYRREGCACGIMAGSLALLAVFAGEVIGRLMFYNMHVALGL